MLPPFTSDGLLPPFLSDPTVTVLGSPYKATIVELVEVLGSSPARKAILRGFLSHRRELRGFGFTDAFQWVDGSFVQRDDLRPPNDIDVVTFARRPAGFESDEAFGEKLVGSLHLFEPPETKARYLTDAYFIDLSADAVDIVGLTRYWFGLFSHTRATKQWKGMLELPLDSLAEDAEAIRLLNENDPTP